MERDRCSLIMVSGWVDESLLIKQRSNEASDM